MNTCSYTKARRNLAAVMEKATNGDHIMIRRRKGRPVIIMALEDYIKRSAKKKKK